MATKETTTKTPADANVGDTHEKVQLWKDGPYWATTNIGAEKPEESGYYFWWGDTVGCKRENDMWVADDGSDSDFSFDEDNTPTWDEGFDPEDEDYDYEWFLKDGGWITEDGVLAPEHDAAHVQWGGEWRMPTYLELAGLVKNCDWTWKTVNGVQGYVVRGRGSFASASIFLPASGYGNGTSLNDAGSVGHYRSSVPSSGSDLTAWNIGFGSRCPSPSTDDYASRSEGLSVRPVQGFTK